MAEERSDNRTRQALDAALRDCLRQKPLEQIRVRELTDRCGIRRQSFYYHFTDVFDLFAWTMDRERQALVRRQGGFLTWQQVLRDLLNRTEQERVYYRALLAVKGRAGLERVLGAAVEGLLEQTLTYYHARCGAPPEGESPRCRGERYAALLYPLLESWIDDGLGRTPEELLDLLEGIALQTAAGAAWQAAPRWAAAR